MMIQLSKKAVYQDGLFCAQWLLGHGVNDSIR